MLFRYTFLALTLALAAPVSAQQYSALSQADLADGSASTDLQPRCLVADDGNLAFYDTAAGLVVYDTDADAGDRLQSSDGIAASTLNDAAGITADRCHDIAFTFDDTDEVTGVYIVLGSGNDDEVVLKFDPDGDTLTRLAQTPGARAVAPVGETLYVGLVQFNGATEDGIVSVSTTGADQTPTSVYENADLDIFDMVATDDGDLIFTSSKFGNGDFDNAIVTVTDPGEATQAVTRVTPCSGDTPVFINCEDGGIEEVALAEVNGTDYLLVSNNAFSSGVRVAAFDLGTTAFVRYVFDANDLVAADGIDETAYTVAFDGYMAFDDDNDVLYLSGRDRDGTDGDADAIYAVADPFAVTAERPAELAGYGLTVPNPLRGQASLRVELPAPSDVRVAVYDLLGREAAVLADGPLAPGVTVPFDTGALAAGAYVIRLEARGASLARTVTVVR